MIYTIRRATPEDIDPILSITSGYQFNLNGNHGYTGTLIPLTSEKMYPLIDAGMFYVAVTNDWNDNGRVIGCVSLVGEGDFYEIRSLAVMEGYRKQNIQQKSRKARLPHMGSALVYASLQKAEMMGARRVGTLARKDYPELIKFFKSHGFRYTEKWPEKLDNDCVDCPVRVFCMEDAYVVDLPSSNTNNYFSSDDRFYL